LDLQKSSHNHTKIGLIALQTNALCILFSLSFTLFSTTLGTAQERNKNTIPLSEVQIDSITVTSQKAREIRASEKPQDTLKKDTLQRNQILPKKKSQNSIDNDSIQKKEFLTDVVTYKADDYMRLNRRENKMYLHDKAEIIYEDMQINAGKIVVDSEKDEVYAYGIKDSAATYVQTPIFKQAGNIVESDSIRFNFKTKKALIYNSKTEQSGFNIYNEVSKRENDSVVYMQNVKFTTSDNIEDPEYYFFARKIKFVPKKKIVTGLVNMFIADVPTPLGLPFAFFPMTENRTSGFIIPSYGEDNDQGFFLQNGGYYFALSDYADLTIQGDYYTNASYAIRSDISYAKRYRFNGGLNLRFEDNITSERGFPDFAKNTSYNIQWQHSKDSKSNPNSRFSASVNIGSSTYFQDSRNLTNIGSRLNNTLSSSINYSRSFSGNPQVDVDIAATHTQNSQTETINLTLPTVNTTVSRIYPFAPKVGTKKGLIQNINMQYTFRGENRFETTDSLFFKPEMFQDAAMGMSHNIPISTNFKLFKYISASAGTNLQELWVFETIEQRYDPLANNADETTGVVNDTIKGFDAYRTYNFTTSLGTTIYGTFNFGKDKKIQTIRHVVRPSISYSINPAFNEFYDEYTIPKDELLGRETDEVVSYSRFEGGFYGAPGDTYSSSIGISLSNTLEAKVRDRDTTALEAKKIKIINNLNFSTSYNLAGDSLKLSPINVSGGIPIVDGKLDLNFRMTLNPYALNNTNSVIDKWNIDNGGSLFRLTSASTSFGYSFSNKDFDGSSKEDKNGPRDDDTFNNGGRDDDLFGVGVNSRDGSLFGNRNEAKDSKTEEQAFYNFKIPWSLRLQYNINYSNATRQNEISSHAINFSGDIELSSKWKVGASSGLDFTNFEFTPTQLRFERDLESWHMNLSWTPFGPYTSWNFFIGIKSSVLSDIKYDKQKQPDRNL